MPTEIDNCPVCEPGVQRVLDVLDDWSARFEGHQREKRTNLRYSYRRILTARVSTPQGDEAVSVQARNISVTGICILCERELVAEEIRLQLRENLVLAGRIVRRRRVHDGFWEHGIEFVRKEPAAAER